MTPIEQYLSNMPPRPNDCDVPSQPKTNEEVSWLIECEESFWHNDVQASSLN